MNINVRAVLISAMVAVGCGDSTVVEPLGQVVLVVDTDMVVPTELDEIQIFVTKPDGTTSDAIRLYAGAEQPPDTLTIVDNGGAPGPVRVTVVGRARRTFVLSRDLEFSFIEDASAVVSVPLLRECVGVTCADSAESCGSGGCKTTMGAPMPWSGEGDPIGVLPDTLAP